MGLVSFQTTQPSCAAGSMGRIPCPSLHTCLPLSFALSSTHLPETPVQLPHPASPLPLPGTLTSSHMLPTLGIYSSVCAFGPCRTVSSKHVRSTSCLRTVALPKPLEDTTCIYPQPFLPTVLAALLSQPKLYKIISVKWLIDIMLIV